jgi:two-component system sensor histidine kinase HupT/HoxJ
MSDRLPPPHPDLPTLPLEGVDESTWVDVIHKMDEVYAQLLADEAAREEKNAELERTQQFILSLLTAMSDVLLACDQQGLIEETNAALCALVGRPDAVLRGTPAAALMMGGAQGEDARRMREALAQSQTRRDGAVVEVALADAQGQPVPVDFNCTPRLDHQGRVIGHVCVGRPLGELKRAYRALQEAHEALKRTQAQLLHSEKMASLGRLVAGVAHELNNPISFLLGNVSALRKYADRLEQYLGAVHAAGPLPPGLAALRQRLRIDAALADLPSVIDGMTEGAHRTADIVNALKRFSVIDRVERSPVDLGQMVEQAIHWVRKGAAPDFRIDWTPPAEPVQVMGSAGQLLQVMLNLIQNAADACAGRPEGRLRITLEPPERRGGKLRLRFADNGPGIAPEHVARVFDPFFTTKPVGKGTGLGLSISYGLIDQHGGQLSLAPAAGGGAEFTVELPVAEAA